MNHSDYVKDFNVCNSFVHGKECPNLKIMPEKCSECHNFKDNCKELKVYGLFERTYDFHEWNDIICVSDSTEKLTKHYNEIEEYQKSPLISQEEYEKRECNKNEIGHYIIKEVESI